MKPGLDKLPFLHAQIFRTSNAKTFLRKFEQRIKVWLRKLHSILEISRFFVHGGGGDGEPYSVYHVHCYEVRGWLEIFVLSVFCKIYICNCEGTLNQTKESSIRVKLVKAIVVYLFLFISPLKVCR